MTIRQVSYMKLYKCRKLRNTLYRVFMSLTKLLFIVLALSLFALFAFLCLGTVIAYFDCPELLEKRLSFKLLFAWYQSSDKGSGGYVSAIVGATITALLTAITIYQSHYTRKQDRVFSFSKNEVKNVSIGLDKRKNVCQSEPYLKLREGNVIVNLEYDETFSTYYVGHPVVVYVLLEMRGEKKFKLGEKLKIYADKYYYKNGKPNLLLETQNSRLLRLYSSKTNENRDYKLSLLLDIRWCNSLLPWYTRGLSALYIRENIELDYAKDTSDKIGNKYKVKYIYHTYIYLISFRWIRVLVTRICLWIENIQRVIDNKRLRTK